MAGGMMYGGKGMSPRKAMGESGGFSTSPYPGSGKQSVPHPDRVAGAGMKPAMGDSERGIGMPVGGKGHMPAQAAPDHGPDHEGVMGFNRADTV